MAAAIGRATDSSAAQPTAEEPPHLIEGIRHAVLAYIFKSQCMSQASASGSSEARARFFYHFNNYMALVLWKVGCPEKHFYFLMDIELALRGQVCLCGG